MEKKIASESLVQQGRSALFTDLVSLCQSSQDALQEASNSSLKVLSALRKIGFTSALMKLIKKHMNINLTRIDIDEDAFPNAMCVLYATKFFDKTVTSQKQTIGQVLEKINILYDDKQGYLEKPLHKESPLLFYLCITTGWWTAKKDGRYFLTSEEMAAIILHELGHLDHYIRQIQRVYYRMMDAHDLIDYTLEQPNNDIILKIIDKLKTSSYLNKNWKDVLTTTETYFKQPSLDDASYLEVLSALSALVTAEAAWYNLSSFSGNIVYPLSDEIITNITRVDIERSADEFASRNGAYEALSSALTKIYSLVDKNSYLYYKQFLWAAPAAIVASLQKFKALFDVSGEEITGTYDPLVRRLELIVETGKHSFGQMNLPSHIKQDIRTQLKDCETYIKEYRSTNQYKMRLKIISWLETIRKTNRLVFAPFHNRLIKDYERLQQATRSISRNPFYYLNDQSK